MTVHSLAVDPFTGLPVVLLSDAGGRTLVPISVGLGEASAIATELDEIELERPMTHHLLKSLLDRAGVTVEAIEIHDLVDNTFYARIYLDLPGGQHIVQDGRPSDAIALALRAGADIFVNAQLAERLGDVVPHNAWEEPTLPGGFAEMDLTNAGDEVFGKWKM